MRTGSLHEELVRDRLKDQTSERKRNEHSDSSGSFAGPWTSELSRAEGEHQRKWEPHKHELGENASVS